MSKRSMRTYYKNVVNGRCSQCGQPNCGRTYTCERCRALACERQRRYRERRQKESKGR